MFSNPFGPLEPVDKSSGMLRGELFQEPTLKEFPLRANVHSPSVQPSEVPFQIAPETLMVPFPGAVQGTQTAPPPDTCNAYISPISRYPGTAEAAVVFVIAVTRPSE